MLIVFERKKQRELAGFGRRVLGAAAALVVATLLAGEDAGGPRVAMGAEPRAAAQLAAHPLRGSGGEDAPLAGACLGDPEVVRLGPTQSAPGARGSMVLTQPGSPFEITVDRDGFQTFHVEIRVEQLPRRRGAKYLVWVAKPELDEYKRIGALPGENRIAGRVAWNQFIVFVSEETSEDVERWQGPIVLTGISPSGRLHTMAGHGPFEDVSCQQYY